LATAVAFERLLFNGENLAHRLVSRFDPEGDSAQLMHIATDGESYGHHHPHGDMALAYALQYIEENNLARLTNYGEYYVLHPPTQEVQIKQKSSWSCAHGVGRWESNCGCNAGHSGWTQEWRKPLRDALDWLRDDLAPAYQREAKKLLFDPWAARDEYVAVVLDRSAAGVEPFLEKHSSHDLTANERVKVLRLLEMQRHLMLMYTSCGWFFDEPTGPETIQVLQYAARAVQLGEQLFGGSREEEFLKRLELVRSNIPEFGTGRDIYERFVRPAMLDLPGVAAHYAITSLFDGFHRSDLIYAYTAELHDVHIFENGELKLAVGAASITSTVTHAKVPFNFAVLHAGGHNLRAGICQAHNGFSHFIAEARLCLSRHDFADWTRRFEQYFGSDVYSLKSLFHDERQRIVGQIVDSTLANIDELYRDVYQHNTGLIGFLREIGMTLPPILRVSSEFVLSNEVRRHLSCESIDFASLRQLLDTAKRHGIGLDSSLHDGLRERLEAVMRRWAANPLQLQTLVELEPLVALARVPFETDLWRAQNIYYELMEALSRRTPPHPDPEWSCRVRSIAEHLGIALCEIHSIDSANPPKDVAKLRPLDTVAELPTEAVASGAWHETSFS
jgi:hypothetical protein